MANGITGNGYEKAQEQRLHFLDYWRVIQKRKEVIIATLIIVVLATAVLSMTQKKQYIAKAQVSISSQERSVELFRPEIRQAGIDPMEITTHVTGLMFEDVLKRVVKGDISEGETEYYCPDHQEPMTKEDLRRAGVTNMVCPEPLCDKRLVPHKKRKYPRWEPLNEKWTRRDKPDANYTVERAVNMLKRKLKVRPERGAYLINVSYQSESPVEAAQIATMVAEAYIQFHNEKQEEKLNHAMSILQNEIRNFKSGDLEKGQEGLDQLEEQLYKLQQELEIPTEQATALSPGVDLANYKRDYVQLTLNLVEVEEKIKQLKDLDDSEKQIDATQQNQNIAQIKNALVAAEVEKSRMEKDYGPKHDAYIAQVNLIQVLKDELKKEGEGIITFYEISANELRARKRELESLIKKSETALLKTQADWTMYSQLKREVDVGTSVYQNLILRKFQETVTAAIPLTDITLVQPAEVPLRHSKPDPVFNIILSFFIGLFVGTGLAYFIEYLDTSVKTIDDIERYLNIPILGIIPQDAKLLTEEDQKSPVAEAYRMLWTNIEFANGAAEKVHTLLVTSGGIGEGKTTTAANLAIAIAQMGYKVLLVDSDLRRPRIHKLLKCSNRIGWADVLLDRLSPTEATLATEVEGLWVVPSGKLPPNIVSLLNAQRLRRSINGIAKDFDIIIFDSPPVIGVSDASIAANLIDAVLLVIEYRKYPKAMATRAKKALENVGANLIGGVVNNLNVIKEDYYYYSQMYHYQQQGIEEEEEETQSELDKSASGKGSEQAPQEIADKKESFAEDHQDEKESTI